VRENIETHNSVKRRVSVILKTTVFKIDNQVVVDVGVAVGVEKSELVAMFILNNMLKESLCEQFLPERDHHQAPIESQLASCPQEDGQNSLR